MYFSFVKKAALLILFIGIVVPMNLLANDVAWQALRDGKAVAIMRHAIAPSGVDNSDLTRDACEDERNLSQTGRDQAVTLGEVFRDNGVVAAKVYTSSLCRCVDTGVLLGFDEPVLLSAINAYYPDRSIAPAQTADLKQWITQQLLQAAEPNILVTHGFNVTDLTGDFVSQGEFLIITVEDDVVVTLLRGKADSY